MNAQGPATKARPFSLGLYLLVVFGLSWPFFLASATWADSLLSRYALHSTAMVMVTVGTFIAGRHVFRDGFAGAGWRWGRPAHYLAVVGLALCLWAVPTLIDLALGTSSLPSGLTTRQIVWIFVLLFVTLIPGFGEEFGWRGYMLPRLARRFSPRRAVLVHSFIWWAWHLPMLAGTAASIGTAAAPEAGAPAGLSVALVVGFVLLASAVPAIASGVVFAYIWSRTQSLAVAAVYHATYDGVRDSFQVTISTGPVASFWANVLLIAIGAYLLWKGSWANLEARATA